jgi:CheY-like chemotaxis protein
LESEPGKGSHFFFTLPGSETSLNEIESNEDEESSIKSKTETCILVAEDDDLSYTLIKESLRRVNIRTCHARNGREAIDLVKNMENISLILMDIKLPEINGLMATREIKKFKPEIPIIAQSAYASQADIRQSIEAGCDDYITKPIDIRVLMNKISRHNLQAS